MASPQTEDGYTKIAHELIEAMIRHKLSDSEWRVLLAVMRLCYGFNKCRAPISIGRLEKMTGLERHLLVKALQRLEERDIISVNREEYINVIGVQKDYELWDVQSSALQNTSALENTSALRDTKTSALENTHNRKKIYIPVFEHWNEKGIIKHRTLTEKMKRAINGRIREGYGLEDITGAIDNYAVVLCGPEYFFSYRWTLNDFLTRGLERFLDEARPLENFRRDKEKAGPCRNAGAPYPRSEMTPSTLGACGCELCREEIERRRDEGNAD